MTEPQTASDAPVQEGEILAGKYRVEKVLGVGGMGVVVAAMHLELEQRVALKFLLKAAAENPLVVARFAREARAAAKIKSQHVARVSDVGTLENGIPYIVMEHLEGSDLADLLTRDGPLPPAVAVDYILEACEAIAEAHAAGFVHRDLKPSNLFLARQADGTEIVKVLDFGISKAVLTEGSDGETADTKKGALTGTTEIFGSPMYMSPEQLKASRDVDARSDIWALGTILYELCTGTSPFDRPTVAETFGAILYEKPVPPSERVKAVPAALDAVILRCIEKDASLRFANVADLAKALFPSAERATKLSIERTSGVLRRAGHTIASIPPPAPRLNVAAATNLTPPAGASTRTSWGATDRAPKQRSLAVIVALVAATLGSAGYVGWSRLHGKRPPPVPAAHVEPVQPPVVVAQAPTPTSTPSAVIPSITASAAPPVTSASAEPPSTAASAVAAVANGASGAPVHGKLPPPHGPKPGAGHVPGLPGTAPAPAAKPTEDPDGFGDRK